MSTSTDLGVIWYLNPKLEISETVTKTKRQSVVLLNWKNLVHLDSDAHPTKPKHFYQPMTDGHVTIQFKPDVEFSNPLYQKQPPWLSDQNFPLGLET